MPFGLKLAVLLRAFWLISARCSSLYLEFNSAYFARHSIHIFSSPYKFVFLHFGHILFFSRDLRVLFYILSLFFQAFRTHYFSLLRFRSSASHANPLLFSPQVCTLTHSSHERNYSFMSRQLFSPFADYIKSKMFICAVSCCIRLLAHSHCLLDISNE